MISDFRPPELRDNTSVAEATQIVGLRYRSLSELIHTHPAYNMMLLREIFGKIYE